MLVYLIKGRLPWMGMSADLKEELADLVLEKK